MVIGGLRVAPGRPRALTGQNGRQYVMRGAAESAAIAAITVALGGG